MATIKPLYTDGVDIIEMADGDTIIGGGGLQHDADCTVSESVGDCVYISGAEVGDRIQVRKAVAADLADSPCWGVIIEKPSATTAVVQAAGEIDGAAWPGTLTLTPGKIVRVGLDGRPTTTPPAPSPSQNIGIQAIGISHGASKFALNVMPDVLEIHGA